MGWKWVPREAIAVLFAAGQLNDTKFETDVNYARRTYATLGKNVVVPKKYPSLKKVLTGYKTLFKVAKSTRKQT